MSGVCGLTVFSSTAMSGVRRHDGSRYATLMSMQRTALARPGTAGFSHGMANAWITRRWYYTPKSHRAYSVRPVSPGDRRLLAEFVLGLSRAAPEREQPAVRTLTAMLFDRVISAGSQPQDTMGFTALESTAGGD